MPVTLPLELALLIVQYAVPRRLDDGRLEHRQRLARIGLVCKAFYKAVESALTARLVHLKGYKFFATGQLEDAVRRGRLADVIVNYGRQDDPFDILQANGKAVRSLMHTGKARKSCSTADYNAQNFPSAFPLLSHSPTNRTTLLNALSLFFHEIRPQGAETLPSTPIALDPRTTTSYLAITDLALRVPLRSAVILDFLRPDLTPNLRALALLDAYRICNQDNEPAATLLSNAAKFSRLDFLQLHYNHAAPDAARSDLSGLRHVVPTLGCGPYCDCDYIQLTTCESDDTVIRWGRHTLKNRLNRSVDALVAAIARGAGRKALFLPYDMGCDPQHKVQLHAAIEKYEVAHVGDYCADETIDTSTSEPFRRYLDKERLEGRM